MTMSLISLMLFSHFLGDFILQSDWMALGKSKSWKPLLAHTSVYSLCFLWLGWQFALITFALHTITDAITSRWTSSLWFVRLIEPINGPGSKFYGAYDMTKRHWFFVVIGLDQLIHGVTLLWTLHLLS